LPLSPSARRAALMRELSVASEVQNDDKRETNAFRALRGLFLRVQLSDPTTAWTSGTPRVDLAANCVTHLNRRLLRESWLPAWPAAAKGQR
jgi:hypothetical protein